MKRFVKVSLLVVIALAGFYQLYQFSLQPTKPGNAVIIDIPQGSSSSQIASLLEEHHIIKNKQSFIVYLRQTGKGRQLQAGKYQFQPGESVDRVIDQLASGQVYVDSIDVTIPEGWTVKQIAGLLAEKGLVDEKKFLNEVNKGSFSYPFVKDIPKSLPYRLEGYLFPKTYQFQKELSEHEIIDRMLAQFDKEYNPAWSEQLNKHNFTIHEMVTLASIVEREVAVAKERPIVAGVYFNRIQQDIMLQADATVQYGLGEQKDRLTYKDLELDHPYNTYKHKGLPPGPIAAPGISALEAVVNPTSHEFLFYVTKKDGSGEHFFSKTYQEHLRNIAVSKQTAR
ncbi:hypothetical protein BEP19_05850 [Ammoniphilus oxalaticus]|uniref:Endolytic murein transglycosylase n=1 Tax=Ammoniphilus oxalaticus TaxID=66863 RepID=A0A419SIX9_9BACL|nr:endolytic transglycosylase MltG [Ammoniphilus oxalaticus]RKD23945.1 hypothetical protein BEP19_05850 [Ammoniphilus oxalaticus]